MRALRAELAKLATLPFVWLAVAAGLAAPTGIVVITSLTGDPGIDTGFAELALGVVGAIMLGVVAISSEYTTEGEEAAGSRQVTTTLTCVPSRARLLVAKAGAVVLVTAVLAIAAIALVFATAHLLLGAEAPALDGQAVARMGGVVIYWVLMALLGLALSVLTRNGVIPMVALVVNSSAVTVTYLLALRFPVASYLPDLAGLRMFTHVSTGIDIAPVTGGVVMTAWVALLLLVAGVVFSRRDA